MLEMAKCPFIPKTTITRFYGLNPNLPEIGQLTQLQVPKLQWQSTDPAIRQLVRETL